MSEHSPEPWRTYDCFGDRFAEVFGPSEKISISGSRAKADARRIVACVNFCREFPTEALEGRQLVYLKQAQWESLADMPKFDGLMAVRKIDEVGNSPGGTTPPGVM